MNSGKLYLIPTTLGEIEPLKVLPISVKQIVEQLNIFIVEKEKSARGFIKKLSPKKSQESLKILRLDKYTDGLEVFNYLDACKEGESIGLLSDAGVPCIADPGAQIVKLAHEKGIQVVPLVGPSSILLAMMASGMNGQDFAFNGYLSIDSLARKKEIRELEGLSFRKNRSQVFIETPYRNEKLFQDLITVLASDTRLCIATDISLSTEFIRTLPVKAWKNTPVTLHKRPTIFIIHKDAKEQP